jgi:catechol 2,3-dioxygenase-like lactoylglutathione lyase family enzyme
MTIQRMDHVGVVVDDLAAATAFSVELGMELEGQATAEGRWGTLSSGSTVSESRSRWCGLLTATAGLS